MNNNFKGIKEIPQNIINAFDQMINKKLDVKKFINLIEKNKKFNEEHKKGNECARMMTKIALGEVRKIIRETEAKLKDLKK